MKPSHRARLYRKMKDVFCYTHYCCQLIPAFSLLWAPPPPPNYSSLLEIRCGHLTSSSQSIYLYVRGAQRNHSPRPELPRVDPSSWSCCHDHNEQRALQTPNRFHTSKWFKPLRARVLLFIAASPDWHNFLIQIEALGKRKLSQ